MMDTETSKFSGHCLCGLVRFECDAKPEFQVCCHCDDCRRAGGGYGYGLRCSAPPQPVILPVWLN